MTGDEYVKGQLATIAWIDGLESGLNGCLGIAHTAANRVRAGWHSGDWVAVVWGLIRQRERYWGEPPDVRDPQFQTLLQAVDNIYDGSLVDRLTDGALYYVRKDESGILAGGRHIRTATIGQLIFYK